MQSLTGLDDKQLIREAYRIEGITESQCRSIFLDWALSLPTGLDHRSAITQILDHYSGAPADHPMTQVLRQGLTDIGEPRRRGGWRTRPRD
ncbi:MULTISPECIES: hypothetical protein [Pseudophaeobacter]|jgi:hypothetical protein|uniref:hypothetical protein n=1 Tax=Pseudophaeobacter TaxID=1541822 RepID=UPI00242D1984|nr:hypothetical protein [Pseudophaeobacter profundi]